MKINSQNSFGKTVAACGCCGVVLPLVHEEVDLGPVCHDCRVNARAAAAWLKHVGLRVCNHHKVNRTTPPNIPPL